MITADLSSIQSVETMLENNVLSTNRLSVATPSLAGYSPIPSLQAVATQHSSAIIGASGSATLVSAALGREVEWAATNLRSLSNVIKSHEDSVSGALNSINTNGGGSLNTGLGLSAITDSFEGRPPFNPGALVFSPAMVAGEIGHDATTLLSMFSSTNDGAVLDAVAYWTDFASAMTALALEITAASEQLIGSNDGLVFDTATATLGTLADRAINVATSASTMATHLQVLPAVKAMAVNALTSIEAQSALIEDPVAREQFERTEIAAFLTGPYTAQLQAAVPNITKLTEPNISSGAATTVQAGLNGLNGPAGTSTSFAHPDGYSGATHTASATAPGATSTASPTPLATSMTSTGTPGNVTTNPALATSSRNGLPQPITGLSSAPRTQGTDMLGMPTHTAAASLPKVAPDGALTSPQGTAPHSTSSPHSISPVIAGPTPLSHGGTTHQGGARRPGSLSTTGAHNLARQQSATPQTATRNVRPGAISIGRGANSAFGRSGLPTGREFLTQTGNNGSQQTHRPHLNTGIHNRTSMPGASGTIGSTNNNGAIRDASRTQQAGSPHQPRHPHGSALLSRGGRGKGDRRNAMVEAVQHKAIQDFEQSEFQRELFGDEPATVPAVIGGESVTGKS